MYMIKGPVSGAAESAARAVKIRRHFNLYRRGCRDNLDSARDLTEIMGSLIGIWSPRGAAPCPNPLRLELLFR